MAYSFDSRVRPAVIGGRPAVVGVRLFRQTDKRLSVKFPRLLCCLRQEQAEIGGGRHFHCLLAGLPPAQLCPSLNFELMALWQQLGGGWARVMRYRDDLDGVGYVLKGLGWASQSEQNYEM